MNLKDIASTENVVYRFTPYNQEILKKAEAIVKEQGRYARVHIIYGIASDGSHPIFHIEKLP